MSRLTKYLNQKTLITIYNALILPYFDYCELICGKTLHNKLQLLNRAARVILREGTRSDVDSMLAKLRWKKLSVRHDFHVCQFVHECLYDNVPLYLANKYTKVHTFHKYGTRSAINGLLSLSHNILETGKRTLTFRGAVLCNNLPLEIKYADSSNFKQQYFKYMRYLYLFIFYIAYFCMYLIFTILCVLGVL